MGPGGATDGGPSRLRVTLVHGTWARGPVRLGRWREDGADAGWCRPGSTFRRGLEATLRARGVEFEIGTLRWSGANSILERDRVARRLADLLAARHSPGVRELVIGHSHGGSVAMRSLEHLATMGAALPSVATIATPFLAVEEGSLFRSRLGPRILAALFLTAWAYISLVVSLGGVPSAGVALLLKYVALPSIALVSYVCVGLLAAGPPGWSDRVADAARVRPRDADHDLLVLRGMEDEAGMALSLGLLGVRLSDLLSSLANVLWMTILAVGLGAIAAGAALLLVAGGYMLVGAAPPGWIAALLDRATGDMGAHYGIAWWLGVFALLTLLAPGVFKVTFGRELVLGSGMLAVTAHSVPDVDRRVRVATLGRARQADALLLHSLYDHDDCPRLIGDWVAPRASAPVGRFRRAPSVLDATS